LERMPENRIPKLLYQYKPKAEGARDAQQKWRNSCHFNCNRPGDSFVIWKVRIYLTETEFGVWERADSESVDTEIHDWSCCQQQQ
jgi:hypothetical protein